MRVGRSAKARRSGVLHRKISDAEVFPLQPLLKENNVHESLKAVLRHCNIGLDIYRAISPRNFDVIQECLIALTGLELELT